LTTSLNQDAFPCDWSLPPKSQDSVRRREPSGLIATATSHFGGALYSDFLIQGVSHFFPAARVEAIGGAASTHTELVCDCKADGTDGDRVRLEWLGQLYTLRRLGRPFTEGERRLIHAIGQVLTARYQALFNPDIATKNFHLFRGLPEDRYVSAFLDPAPYTNLETLTAKQDRVADAIEALRVSSLTTYENRRISTGVLLLGRGSLTAGFQPTGDGALRYSSALTSIRSFFRLCDGMQTVALVDAEGHWIDIVDLEQWAGSAGVDTLPLPSPSAYTAHCRATLGTPDLCLALTPNGEIKAFARGVQVFSFLNGRWRLTDMEWKYRRWLEAVSDERLANRILQVGLDMAESRRGGLFVILDDVRSVSQLVAPGDLLDQSETPALSARNTDSKLSLYYLLRGKRIDNLAPSVLRTLAAIDGGIVLDTKGNLLAFGAILRHYHDGFTADRRLPEGGRSVAALAASHFGKALKVSEDGMISFFNRGQLVWEV
jgi:hypothetical protein